MAAEVGGEVGEPRRPESVAQQPTPTQPPQSNQSSNDQTKSSTNCSGSFVTQDKLDRLDAGMSLEQVEQVLGQSERRVNVHGGITTYRWKLDCDTPFDLMFVWGGLNGVPFIGDQ